MDLNSLALLSVLLFSMGIIGVISRKNIFVIYISLELMLNAVNIMLVSLSRYFSSLNAQAMSMMIIAVCAAEAALFLSLIVLLYRRKSTLNADAFDALSQNRDKYE